jgi:hypothetical protein
MVSVGPDLDDVAAGRESLDHDNAVRSGADRATLRVAAGLDDPHSGVGEWRIRAALQHRDAEAPNGRRRRLLDRQQDQEEEADHARSIPEWNSWLQEPLESSALFASFAVNP